MAKLFLITYDLKKPGQNYTDLYDAIKDYEEWQHPLESTWIIRVNDSIRASDVYIKIRPKLDDGDFLFIVDITDKEYYGWLSTNFWSWFKKE